MSLKEKRINELLETILSHCFEIKDHIQYEINNPHDIENVGFIFMLLGAIMAQVDIIKKVNNRDVMPNET